MLRGSAAARRAPCSIASGSRGGEHAEDLARQPAARVRGAGVEALREDHVDRRVLRRLVERDVRRVVLIARSRGRATVCFAGSPPYARDQRRIGVRQPAHRQHGRDDRLEDHRASLHELLPDLRRRGSRARRDLAEPRRGRASRRCVRCSIIAAASAASRCAASSGGMPRAWMLRDHVAVAVGLAAASARRRRTPTARRRCRGRAARRAGSSRPSRRPPGRSRPRATPARTAPRSACRPCSAARLARARDRVVERLARSACTRPPTARRRRSSGRRDPACSCDAHRCERRVVEPAAEIGPQQELAVDRHARLHADEAVLLPPSRRGARRRPPRARPRARPGTAARRRSRSACRRGRIPTSAVVCFAASAANGRFSGRGVYTRAGRRRDLRAAAGAAAADRRLPSASRSAAISCRVRLTAGRSPCAAASATGFAAAATQRGRGPVDCWSRDVVPDHRTRRTAALLSSVIDGQRCAQASCCGSRPPTARSTIARMCARTTCTSSAARDMSSRGSTLAISGAWATARRWCSCTGPARCRDKSSCHRRRPRSNWLQRLAAGARRSSPRCRRDPSTRTGGHPWRWRTAWSRCH